MKKVIFALLAYWALFAFSAIVGDAQTIRSDDSRRTIYGGTSTTLSVYTIPMWVNQSSLDGYSRTTASDLGWDRVEVWNEAGNKALPTLLKPNAVIWVLNGQANPTEGYLDGCTKAGRPFMNRVRLIKIVTVVQPTPTPVPPPAKPECTNMPGITQEAWRAQGLTVTDDGRCVKPVAEKLPPPEAEDCPECPPDVKMVPHASTKTRFTGGLMNTGISAGIGCVVSGILNRRMEDCLRDAAISAGANRVVQAVNPTPDGVKVTANGETKIFRRGKGGEIGDCEVEWEGNVAILRCGELVCRSLALNKNVNLTAYSTRRVRSKIPNIIPTKTQTSSQIPTRPRIPPLGTNGPVQTVPTRPRATTNGFYLQ